MWLINTDTFKLEHFLDETKPPYAILSHTWGARETSFSDFIELVGVAKSNPKIFNTCRIAKEHGLNYVWVDTCCIDKRSSAELSEAINSMYRWYLEATICFVYLNDVSNSMSISDGIRDCRWRTRGWTLQELIAPKIIRFFDSEWQFIGDKTDLIKPLSKYTRIPAELLAGIRSLDFYEAASKMAWASDRRTSRIEDLAYCLMGIFDVNMSLLYGEGRKAFQRLQEEILNNTPDLSLLLWHGWTNDGLDLQNATLNPLTKKAEQRIATSSSDESIVKQQSTLLPVLAESPEDFLLANSDLAIAIDEAIEVSMNHQSLVLYNERAKIRIEEFGYATTANPMQYWLDVRAVLGGRQAKTWLPLRKIAPSTFAIENRKRFMPPGGLISSSVTSKLCLVLRPSVHTISRAVDVRISGIRVPPVLLPGFYISTIRPQSHWDATDQIFFREPSRSGNRPVFSIELHAIDSDDQQRFMILFEPEWSANTCCRIARVSGSKVYTPIDECSPYLNIDIRNTGASWDLLVTRWPEILEWKDVSHFRTADKARPGGDFSANLRPARMDMFGIPIEVFDLILKPI